MVVGVECKEKIRALFSFEVGMIFRLFLLRSRGGPSENQPKFLFCRRIGENKITFNKIWLRKQRNGVERRGRKGQDGAEVVVVAVVAMWLWWAARERAEEPGLSFCERPCDHLLEGCEQSKFPR